MHPCELPDHVVVAILKREALLNRVRLHTVQIQDIVGKERLRSAQTKQCQVCFGSFELRDCHDFATAILRVLTCGTNTLVIHASGRRSITHVVSCDSCIGAATFSYLVVHMFSRSRCLPAVRPTGRSTMSSQ